MQAGFCLCVSKPEAPAAFCPGLISNICFCPIPFHGFGTPSKEGLFRIGESGHALICNGAGLPINRTFFVCGYHAFTLISDRKLVGIPECIQCYCFPIRMASRKFVYVFQFLQVCLSCLLVSCIPKELVSCPGRHVRHAPRLGIIHVLSGSVRLPYRIIRIFIKPDGHLMFLP